MLYFFINKKRIVKTIIHIHNIKKKKKNNQNVITQIIVIINRCQINGS